MDNSVARSSERHFFLLLLLMSNWSFASASKQDTAIVQAKELLIQGKRKEAVSLIRSAIQETPAKNRSQLQSLESKRAIIAEQFITAENFQKYQDIKAYADAELWQDCIRSIQNVGPHDQGNLLVLRMKAVCQSKNGQWEDASRTMFEILQLEPNDATALIGLAQISLERRQYAEGLRVIEPLVRSAPTRSADRERLAIVRASLLEASGRFDEAVRVLLDDQQANLNHLEVIYQLGKLYQRKANFDWQARRSFSLFVSRVRKMSSTEIAQLKLEIFLNDALSQLAILDKKLQIDGLRNEKGSINQ